MGDGFRGYWIDNPFLERVWFGFEDVGLSVNVVWKGFEFGPSSTWIVETIGL